MYKLFLTIFCEILFINYLNTDIKYFLPLVSEKSRWDFRKFEIDATIRFIDEKCPHFGYFTNSTRLSDLRRKADVCWRESRLLGDSKLTYNPRQLTDERLCERLMRYCRDQFFISDCPNGTKEERIRLLEKCFYSFIPIKSFQSEKLHEIQTYLTHRTISGLAVIVYGCRPNPFLYVIREIYIKSDVLFLILCPKRRDEKIDYPSAELISMDGSKLTIDPIYSISEEENRHLKLEVAEKLEIALEMLSKKSSTLTIVMFTLTTVPILTYMAISMYLPRFEGRAIVWIPFVVMIVPTVGPMFFAQLFRGVSMRVWRRRLIWMFPLNSLVRLNSWPFMYFCGYFLFAFLFGRVTDIVIDFVCKPW